MIVYRVHDMLEGEMQFVSNRREAMSLYAKLEAASVTKVEIPSKITKAVALTLLNGQQYAVSQETIVSKQ